MIKEAIEKLMQAENLTYDQVKESVDEIMTCLLYTSPSPRD